MLRFFVPPEIDEVFVGAGGEVWCSQAGAPLSEAKLPLFHDMRHYLGWLQELARRHGVRLDLMVGAAGGNLEKGLYRWHCILPPLSPEGPILSVRRHRFETLSWRSFAGTASVKDQLIKAVVSQKPLLIVGPTGCGKTTLLASLLAEYAAKQRVITIETLAELPLSSTAWVRMVERKPNIEGTGAFSLTRLLQEALRLRPDRIVIGEIRADEAAAFLDSLICGHEGALATLHASGPQDALARLMSLAATAGWSRPRDWPEVPLLVVTLRRGAPPVIVSVENVPL